MKIIPIKPIPPLVLMLRHERAAVYDRRTKREKPYETLSEAIAIVLSQNNVDIKC